MAMQIMRNFRPLKIAKSEQNAILPRIS